MYVIKLADGSTEKIAADGIEVWAGGVLALLRYKRVYKLFAAHEWRTLTVTPRDISLTQIITELKEDE